MIQADHIVLVMSGESMDGEVSVQVGEEDLQVDSERMLLESLEDVPPRDEDDHVHASAENFIRFFAQINVIRNSNAGRMTGEYFPQDAAVWVATGNQSRSSDTLLVLLGVGMQLLCQNPGTARGPYHFIQDIRGGAVHGERALIPM
jgi:hypothetical protein